MAIILNSDESSLKQKRLLRLRLWMWGKAFALRLKGNRLRMKQFLRAGG